MNTIEDAFHPYLEHMTLLCVEDTKTIQLIYKSVFDIVFKEVLIANNGQEALELLQQNKVDIIITDYEMPIMNGIEMISELKKTHSKIPIIFVTAIEESDVVVNALNLGVHNFLHKPFDIIELNECVESAAKMVIANATLLKTQQEHSSLLEQKAYQNYQEELTFRKELTILRNDFYYQRQSGKRELLIDFLYMPLDTLSGDAYSARHICEDQTLFFITDGMGKGLSASLTAMLFTSFMNHRVDIMLEEHQGFSLKTLIEESIGFVKKVLLDEEVLSAEFILLDEKTETMHYALFSIPSLMVHHKDDSIHYIKSNNPPINKYQNHVKIDSMSLEHVQKLLFFSDGLIENCVEDTLYMNYLEEDFKQSFTKEEFKKALLSRIKDQEDDITFIFLSYTDIVTTPLFSHTFYSTIESVDHANNWYEQNLHDLGIPFKVLSNATMTFSELFMNAFEHGSLHIDSSKKEQLIAEDTYSDYLTQISQLSTQPIYVEVSKLTYYNANEYLLTIIKDEGEGFDTQLLSTIFRNREKYNGKGVFISRNSSDGIYYNSKANSVLFLHRI